MKTETIQIIEDVLRRGMARCGVETRCIASLQKRNNNPFHNGTQN
jgi:hypothetical protein